MTDTGDLWVFGYGSLMWKPGFDFAEARKATLHGYARRFCLDSITYRGTPDFPGLVLALDEDAGARCDGLAYRVPEAKRGEVHDYLRARELITYSYIERFLPLEIEGGLSAPALCYVMDRGHTQYNGGLTLQAQAEVIAKAVGPAGPNAEYLEKTVEQLSALGVVDVELAHLSALVAAIQNRALPPDGSL